MMQRQTSLPVDVIVRGRRQTAVGVVTLELVHARGESLPSWRPGAHIDLILEKPGEGGGKHSLLERQYSLCGNPEDRSSWEISVLLDDASRGGSSHIHAAVETGTQLVARGPRNHFELEPASRYVFVAGGIGITPIVPMIREVHAHGIRWSLFYSGRSLATMAFAAELREAFPANVHVFAQDEGLRFNVATALTPPPAGTLLYCCGPARLIDAVESHVGAKTLFGKSKSGWVPGSLRTERFIAPTVRARPTRTTAFEVRLSQSGVTLTVPPEKSILEVLEGNGHRVLSSCREGTCGSCETPVVSGTVDHRDSVLTPAERSTNACLMICVSRATCDRLVLDI
jgi:ferredoxin-NADP reductase